MCSSELREGGGEREGEREGGREERRGGREREGRGRLLFSMIQTAKNSFYPFLTHDESRKTEWNYSRFEGCIR